ncbi:toxin-antitoxin system HicB family antitoxin [Roseococcus sp. SYP-B2431]|uniref:type II toxin-antitoxin system HicB family antitoxin n=1 Tax=Roseococcus sp. SYP-B2431 TaxID=2496640 RepID=UPI00103C18B9|nr:toxin-antitoxin system HicB family antitoxin [Roseococcus sp. SYP-B2431]TCI00174.1 toxin-antitoxin system HicB family antitoxin [Roseococcus sp. SYP-B2431]
MEWQDHYTYRVSWSAEDQEHVATCAEFPSMSWLAADPGAALAGLRKLIRETVVDMVANGEAPPVPLAEQQFSGKFMVRVPPQLHRRLVIEAKEAKVSLNRHVSHKLAEVD